MYKGDLALNNLQGLIYHKTQPNQTYIIYGGSPTSVVANILDCDFVVSKFGFGLRY